MDKSKARAEDSHVVSTEPLDSKDARWTKLVKVHYKNPLGKDAVWESAERATRPTSAVIDGVGVLALIPTAQGAAIVLQKQFRPPVGKVCIEVPAGLLDSGESSTECAIRELKEETGYVGTRMSESDEPDESDESKGRAGGTAGGTAGKEAKNKDQDLGVMFNDPGFTNTNLQLIPLAISPSDPPNQTPTPSLEEDEFITTFTVLVKDLWRECRRLEAEGYAIDARVGTLAEGVKLASELGMGMGMDLSGSGSGKEGTYAVLARRCEEMRGRENVDVYKRDDGKALGG